MLGIVATFPRRQTPPKKKRKDYHVYKEEVREDFNGYCAYCGVHESEWPHGDKNYQLDHFKPKAKPEFRHLKNDFYNIYWCCHICNGRSAKGDNWPSPEEEALGFGFVDLCQDDWQVHYQILPNYQLNPLTPKAIYTIDIIGLNNDAYVKQRRNILQKSSSIFHP